jgi:hypothetical protein
MLTHIRASDNIDSRLLQYSAVATGDRECGVVGVNTKCTCNVRREEVTAKPVLSNTYTVAANK